MKRVPVYPWRRAMILLFTVSVLLTAPVHAAFSYDEGVSGDIDYDTDFNFFTFELGSNTITGHTFFTDVADDFDVFEFKFDLLPGEIEFISDRIEQYTSQNHESYQNDFCRSNHYILLFIYHLGNYSSNLVICLK